MSNKEAVCDVGWLFFEHGLARDPGLPVRLHHLREMGGPTEELLEERKGGMVEPFGYDVLEQRKDPRVLDASSVLGSVAGGIGRDM